MQMLKSTSMTAAHTYIATHIRKRVDKQCNPALAQTAIAQIGYYDFIRLSFAFGGYYLSSN